MSISVPESWHPGEVLAQEARGFENDVWGALEMYQHGAPDWMMLFLSQLPFLSVTTLDENGLPWCSLICNDGNPGFIVPLPDHKMRITIEASQGVPIRACLLRLHRLIEQGETVWIDHNREEARMDFMFAAVGVMLHNRRRNKMEGIIVGVERVPSHGVENDNKFVFDVQATNTFGNCPKYINTRVLKPIMHTGLTLPTLSFESEGMGDVPSFVLSIIENADLAFLATKYSGHDPLAFHSDPPRLGNNHRGGPRGFLRSFWDSNQHQRCIVLPDWSGNRLMMSFGNMMKDPVAGITIPAWSTDPQQLSGVLHLSCKAEVLAGKHASAIIQGVQGAVKLWIKQWTYLEHGLPIVAQSHLIGSTASESYKLSNDMASSDKAGIGWSPYNPPVRLLHQEKQFTSNIPASQRKLAHLEDVYFYSANIARFTFQVEGGDDLFENFQLGMHIIMDCSDLLDTRVKLYSHMAAFKGGEKDLNDDGVRSWTITYAKRSLESNVWHFDLTLRRKNRGGVTPSLFRLGDHLLASRENGEFSATEFCTIPVLGIDGKSVLSLQNQIGIKIPLSLVYFTSGIGITPFLAHIADVAQNTTMKANVLLVAAVREGELDIFKRLVSDALWRCAYSPQDLKRIHLRVFFLISTRKETDESSLFDEYEGGTELEESIPKDVALQWSEHTGQRLDSTSFLESSKDQSTFTLPKDWIAALHEASSIIICASDKYSQVTMEALNAKGIERTKISKESFAF